MTQPQKIDKFDGQDAMIKFLVGVYQAICTAVKRFFCKHDWEPYGKGWANLCGVYYNNVCLDCGKHNRQADELERRNLLLWEMRADNAKKEQARKDAQPKRDARKKELLGE